MQVFDFKYNSAITLTSCVFTKNFEFKAGKTTHYNRLVSVNARLIFRSVSVEWHV